MSRVQQAFLMVFWIVGVGVPASCLSFFSLHWIPDLWLALLVLLLLPGVFGWLLAEPLELRKSLLLAGSVSLLAWFSLGYFAWQWKLFVTSVRNIEVLRSHQRVLSRYREVEGRFPDSLEAANEYASDFPYVFGKDSWGTAMRYEARRDAYVLVSLGRGGMAEALDYWEVRESASFVSVCNDVSADCVASDLGIHRACGK